MKPIINLLRFTAFDLRFSVFKLLSVKTSIIVLLATVFFVSCSRAPRASRDSSTERQAIAYKGEVYRSLDGDMAITIVSSDELELARDGINLICKYTRQPTAIRAVETMMGASQAVYYQIIHEGLKNPDGVVLYSPKALEVAITRKEEEQRAREVALAEERQLAAEAEAAAKAMEARCRTWFEDSKVPTRTIETFKGFFESIIISDTEIRSDPPRSLEVSTIWFGIMMEPEPDIREIDSRPYHPSSRRVFEVRIVHHWDQQRFIDRPVLASEIQTRSGSLDTFEVVFETRAEAERFIDAVKKARSEWRTKWSELLKCR